MATKANPDALLESMRNRAKDDAASRIEKLALTSQVTPVGLPAPVAQVPTAMASESLPEEKDMGTGAPAVGTTMEIALDRLREGPSQSRKFYLKSRIEDRARSLKDQGQLEAVKVYFENGYFVLLEGHYRWKGAALAGFKTLRAEICAKPKSALAAYEFSRTMNRERASLTVLDDAFRIHELAESGAASREELMTVTRYEKQELTRLLAITKLPESIILAVMESPGHLTVRFLYALAQYHEHAGGAAASRLVTEAVEKGMTARELERRLATIDRAPKGRPRSQVISIERGQAKGFVKAFPGGRVELRLDGLTDGEQGAIVDRLKVVLEPLQIDITQ